MLQNALDTLKLGYGVIPLGENAKTPPIPWKPFQERKATPGELFAWFGTVNKTRFNLGIVCGAISGGLYVRDFDDIEKAREFFKKHKPLIKTLVRTRRGMHFYFRSNGRNSQGDKEDGRGEGGYVVAPPSVVDGHQYQFIDGYGLVPPEDLCELPEELVLKRSEGKPLECVVENGEDIIRRIKRSRGFLRNIVSVSGSGTGDKELFRAVVALVQKFLLPDEVALEELRVWNQTNAKPPWGDDRLQHKIREARRLMR